MSLLRGIISKIERFSIHDGPGLRTLVVMKGCPLKCLWCSSPQTQNPHSELLYIGRACEGCGICITVCQQKAVSFASDQSHVETDRNLCVGCGDCVTVCPNRAREISGRYYTTEELLSEVEKDAVFFRRSGGGITVGGGEPTMQASFVSGFLSRCKFTHIKTAMETSAFASWEKLSSILAYLDLVFIDIKHMDNGRHVELTGVSNRIILENAKRSAQACATILRLPVVPGLNDSVENVLNTAFFAKNLGNHLLRLELLPYHKFGRHGYDELERRYSIDAIQPPSEDYMAKLQKVAQRAGIPVKIVGKAL